MSRSVSIAVIAGFTLGFTGYVLAQGSGHAGAAVEGAVVELIDFMKVRNPNITVPKGTTVSFVNNDGSNHIITVDGAKSGRMRHGGTTWTHTFNNAGSFPFHCMIHPQMAGTVVVQ